MANLVCEVLLTEHPLEAPKARFDRRAGAIVEFWGVVRELENDREIDGIEYEAHSTMAEHQLQSIASEGSEQFHLGAVLIYHRIGFVPAGQASLFLQARAPHRAAAFDAGKWMIDELKKRVPIWKRPRVVKGQEGQSSVIPATTPRPSPAATLK